VEESGLEWATADGHGVDHFTAVATELIYGKRGLKATLKRGTAIFNAFTLQNELVAGLSSLFTQMMGFPAIANVYVTGPGLKVSARPHNDLQDVFIVQTAGSKRWRVWPGPDEVYRPHIFHMKGKDIDRVIDPDELGPPLIDTNLNPGDVLYIPRGFIHATSTEGLSSVSNTPSIHITMNLETALVRQTYDSLLVCGYSILADALSSIDTDTFLGLWQVVLEEKTSTIREELPLGFLSRVYLNASTPWQDSPPELINLIVSRMRGLLHEVGPALGLNSVHFQHRTPLQPHIPAIDDIFVSIVKRFVQAQKEYLADYNFEWSTWQKMHASQRRSHFESKYVKRPWKELARECGDGIQPGGKFAEFGGAE